MSDLCTLSRGILGKFPLTIGVGGRKNLLFTSLVDPLLRHSVRPCFETSVGRLEIAPEVRAERLLAFAFENVYRHYERSPLGEYIVATTPEWFVDVGANLGLYSLIARRHGCGTICFEPEPGNVRFLTRNPEVFGTVEPVALSNSQDSLPLYYEEGNPGATSLVGGARARLSRQHVPTTTFSLVVKEHHAQLLNSKRVLVKIDVEGHEQEVVEGIRGVLDMGFRPEFWIEVRGRRSSRKTATYYPVRQFLEAFSYTPYDPLSRLESNFERAVADRDIFDVLFRPSS